MEEWMNDIVSDGAKYIRGKVNLQEKTSPRVNKVERRLIFEDFPENEGSTEFSWLIA